MPCFSPVLCWRSKDVNPTGKRSLVFIEAKGLDNSQLEVPCGGCVGCRLDRSRQWSLRLMHESKLHDLKCFLTLTYDDFHLPANGSLVKAHPVGFLKRLRRRHAFHNDGAKLRYYLCGEYGDENGRPHYHIILFGCDFADKRPHSKNSRGDQRYRSDMLDEVWGHGLCDIGSVTAESCGYVSRYIMKKVNGDLAADHYTRVDPLTGEIFNLQPEYNAMSLKPGIGLNFYEKFKSDFYPRDNAVMKGKLFPVPKYYDRQLEKSDPDLLLDLKELRAERALTRQADSTPSRLKVRREVLLSRISTLKRSL
jgi:hypothetical protein